MAYFSPHTLVPMAKAAGINLPPNLEKFDPYDFPRWHIFLTAQLGRNPPSALDVWNNARVIAEIPGEQLATTTHQSLRDAGFVGGTPYPLGARA